MTDTRTATARRSAARSASDPAASDRRPDRASAGSWPVRERSLIGPVLGVPPLVAVALAVGLTAVGVVVDLLRLGTVGAVFEIGYGAGCLVGVAWVRRRSIFVPAIQPPLLLAVVVPVVAVLVGAPSASAGVTEHLLLAGAPLINAFPAMAVTTVLVLLVAGFRLLRQRTGPDDAVGTLRARLSGRREAATDTGDAPARRRTGRGTAGDGPDRPAPSRSRGRASDDGPRDRRSGRAGTDGDRSRNGTDGNRTGRTRNGTARTRSTGRDGEPRSGRPSRGTGRTDGSRPSRSDGPRDAARSDDAPPDAGRRSARGSSGRTGSSGTGRGSRKAGPASGSGARARRPRPSDPS